MDRYSEPKTITQGEKVSWSRTFPCVTTDTHSIEYRFRGPGEGINVTATVDGAKFEAELTAAATTGLDAGMWQWQAWATSLTDATDTHVEASGYMTVKAGWATGSTDEIDTRTTEEQILAALDAAITGMASATQLEYEISTPAGSKKIKRMDGNQLRALRGYYAKIVAQQRWRAKAERTGTFSRGYRGTLRDR